MMTFTRTFNVCALSLTLVSQAAHADPDTTRAQVQADLIAAQRSGEIAASFAAKSPRELFAGISSGATQGEGKSRAQVYAELVAAQQAGDILVGDLGLSLRELYPSQYPRAAGDTPKTRSQVQMELALAQRHGDIVTSFAAKAQRELLGGQIENVPSSAPRPYAAEAAVGKTRAQVYAELVAAQRAGDVRSGEDGLSDRERFPQRYRTARASPELADAGPGARASASLSRSPAQ